MSIFETAGGVVDLVKRLRIAFRAMSKSGSLMRRLGPLPDTPQEVHKSRLDDLAMFPGVHIGGRGMSEEGDDGSKMDWSGVNAERLRSTLCFVEFPQQVVLRVSRCQRLLEANTRTLLLVFEHVGLATRGIIGSGLHPPWWAPVNVKQTRGAWEHSQVPIKV